MKDTFNYHDLSPPTSSFNLFNAEYWLICGIILYSVLNGVKVLVPIHSLIPQLFFKHMDILAPEVIISYLEGIMCEKAHTKSLYKSVKSWKSVKSLES